MSECPRPGMLPAERLDYSSISRRPALHLPGGARLAVWVIVNVEEWDITQTMPRTVLTPPAGGAPMPDIPNWAWHEYGNRVGFWRLLKAYDDFKIPGVMNINGVAVEAFPEIVQACVDHRLLIEVPFGRLARNQGSIHRKFQIHPMLSPLFGLSTSRRGDLSLRPAETRAIFDPRVEESEFSRIAQLRIAGLQAPFSDIDAQEVLFELG